MPEGMWCTCECKCSLRVYPAEVAQGKRVCWHCLVGVHSKLDFQGSHEG